MTHKSSVEFSKRDEKIQRLIIIEGLANVLVLLAKLAVGISTNSLAVLADAIHSLTDVANNIVAWVVVRLSAQPADLEHPYGHRKFETLAVFGLATLLVVLAFEIAKNAIIQETTPIDTGGWELAVMVSVLLVNIGLSTWQRHWARKLKSDIMLADASHTFADVLTTLLVIVGWQLSAMGYPMLDRICAFGVACLVFYLAYQLFKTAFPVLVDEYAINPDELRDTALHIPGVKGVGRVRSRWIGTDIALDMVVFVDPQMTTQESHDIADLIEQLVEQKFHVGDAFIHIEPFGQTADVPSSEC